MQQIGAGLIAVLIATAGVLAQPHALPPGHIDTYTGEVIVRAGVSNGLAYAGAYVVEERRWFVYQVERPITLSEQRTTGVVEYWHDGFRVTLPRERTAFVFRTIGSKTPPALRPTRFQTRTWARGYGVLMRELPSPPEFTTLDYCSPEYAHCGPFEDDPIGGGGGGTSSCEPRACSITCTSGSCEASCSSGYRAVCTCAQTAPSVPVCACSQC